MRGVSPPWSSALASALERDRQRLLIAFVESRARLLRTTSDQFAGGETERTDALVRTEHDYNALVEAGAEAAHLQADLEVADREATPREVDTAQLLLRQMSELTDAVSERIPPSD